MSLKATTHAWKAAISPTAKLVLLAIADHADDEGVAWPSIGRIEAFTGLARSSVCRLLDELEAVGLIERKRGGPVGRESTRYRVKWSDHGTTSGDKWSDHGTSPTAKLVPQSDTSSPTVGPQVVPQSDPNRKGTVRNGQDDPAAGRDPDRAAAIFGLDVDPESAPPKSKARGTRADFATYAVELGMPAADGEALFDHYEANGWRTGKNPLRDWRAGFRTWKASGWLASQKAGPKSEQRPAKATKWSDAL